MPHQLGGSKAGGLGAELAPARSLLPERIEAIGVFPGDFGFNRGCVLPLANGFVVGEGNVTDVEHVFQQGNGIHRQIPKGVLHRPAVWVVIQCRHQWQLSGVSGIGGTHPDEQQSLPRGCRQAGAPGPPVVGLGVVERLRHALALAVAIETPAVVRAFEQPVVIDPPFAERHQTVGADIGEHPPAVVGGIPPDHQIPLQQREPTRRFGVEVLQIADGPPLFGPGRVHGRSSKAAMFASRMAGLRCFVCD